MRADLEDAAAAAALPETLGGACARALRRARLVASDVDVVRFRACARRGRTRGLCGFGSARALMDVCVASVAL